MCQYQHQVLEKLLDSPVELLFNPSGGFILDIAECVIDRQRQALLLNGLNNIAGFKLLVIRKVTL